MAKASRERPTKVQIQKGPVSTNEQYSMAFPREPDRIREDMQNLADRRSGMTLTKHEPKR